MMRVLRAVLAAGTALAILVLWRQGHALTCHAGFLALPVALAIAWGVYEKLMFRRRAFAEAAFVPGTRLYRFLRGGIVAAIAALAVGAGSAVVLLLDIATRDARVLWVLAADVALLALLVLLMRHALKGTLLPRARRIVVKSWASSINAIVLVGAGAWASFVTAPALYRIGGSLTTYDPGPAAARGCEALVSVLSLKGKLDARIWQAMDGAEAPVPLLLLGWLGFLALGALGAFAYSRYMIEVLDLAGWDGDGDDERDRDTG